MSIQDPFYLVREEIQDSVKEIQTNFSKFDRLPRGNAEKSRLASEVHSVCESILWQLGELDSATDFAARNFQRFQLDDDEVESRRKWTQSTRAQIDLMVVGVSETKNETRVGRGTSRSSLQDKLNSAIEDENQDAINQSESEQQMLMREQDVQLDEISDHVTRLGQVGLTIGQELEDQATLLEDLEGDLDGTQARLLAVQRKLTQVIKKTGMMGQIGIIIFLLVILVVLCAIAFT
ncbi:hypothetical protein CYMTET_15552 [Cymbomonas tetramitiformis]|uniref:t-SNARE coiled-coil homology domain-containing protein n=1 Tax=Cymbomonas tetramitiformis TaxID=36881 RepID=A0AAE0L984_9CHLO|nr:hypothetical protein CYMTET_15552 [Cymbomonas tetramitiformis]